MVHKIILMFLAISLIVVMSSCSNASIDLGEQESEEESSSQVSEDSYDLFTDDEDFTEIVLKNVSFFVPGSWETVVEDNRMYSKDPDENNEDSITASVIETDWSAGVDKTYEFRKNDSFTEYQGFYEVEYEYEELSDGDNVALRVLSRRNDTGEDYYLNTCMFPCSDHEVAIMTFGSLDKEKSYEICDSIISTMSVENFDLYELEQSVEKKIDEIRSSFKHVDKNRSYESKEIKMEYEDDTVMIHDIVASNGQYYVALRRMDESFDYFSIYDDKGNKGTEIDIRADDITGTNGLGVAPDGSIFYVYQDPDHANEDGVYNHLIRTNSDGETVWNVIPEDEINTWYEGKMLSTDNLTFLLSDDSLDIFDNEKGDKIKSVQLNRPFDDPKLCINKENDLFITYSEEGGFYYIFSLDQDSGKTNLVALGGEKIQFFESGNGKYDLYLGGNKGILGINLSEKEVVKLVDFEKTDMKGVTDISGFSVLSEDNFLVYENDGNGNQNPKIVLLQKETEKISTGGEREESNRLEKNKEENNPIRIIDIKQVVEMNLVAADAAHILGLDHEFIDDGTHYFYKDSICDKNEGMLWCYGFQYDQNNNWKYTPGETEITIYGVRKGMDKETLISIMKDQNFSATDYFGGEDEGHFYFDINKDQLVIGGRLENDVVTGVSIFSGKDY